MRAPTWTLVAAALLIVLATGLAAADPGERAGEAAQTPQLTAEETAALARVRDLRQEIYINQLELQLLVAREASEDAIATKAENLYRLQGRMYAVVATTPALRDRLQQARHGRAGRHGQGEGMGRGMEPGMERGMGQGMRPGMGRGRGPGMGAGRGFGMNRGEGSGSGCDGGCGMGMDRDRMHGMGQGQDQGQGVGCGRGFGPGPGAGMEAGPGEGRGGGLGMGRNRGGGRGRPGPGQEVPELWGEEIPVEPAPAPPPAQAPAQ